MKTLFLFLLLGFCTIGNSQDLIQRSREGLSCQSTAEPNILSKRFTNLKNLIEVDLFKFENNFGYENGGRLSLSVDQEQILILRDPEVQEISIRIPTAPDAYFDLQLSRTAIRSSSFELVDNTGKKYNSGKTIAFQGIVKGDHGSIASLVLIGQRMHISFSDRDGTYRVNLDKSLPEIYQLYKDDPINDRRVTCHTTEEELIGSGIYHNEGTQQKSAGDIVEIYVECDYELYLDKGSVTAVSNYVDELFTEVATLYANENITIQVSDIFVWTTPDPYRNMSLSDPATILETFGTVRQDNYDGRLATLIIGRVPSGNGLGGIAWVDVLCSTYNPSWLSGPYSINYGFGRFTINPVPSYSLDVSIMAHELGHNFGSPHTHACSWGPNNNKAIDNCPGFTEGNCGLVTSPTPPQELGTIMSYCNTIDFTKGFGTEPGNLMYSRYVNAGCLVPGEEPCTHINRTYNNTTVSSTEVLADNNITLLNDVSIQFNSNVMWQAENQFIVNGTFTVPLGADLVVMNDECQ